MIMKHVKLIITAVFVFSLLVSTAQDINDTISVEKRMGTVFTQYGKVLKVNQLLDITKSNPEAYAKMKIAKTNNGAATVFAIAGGFLIGWPLGTAMGGGEPNWVLAGVGAGLVAICIPFSIGYTKNAKEAVRIYNSGLPAAEPRKVSLNFGVSNHGVGIRVNF